MPDPFEIVSAELMQPEQISKEFVEEHTEYSKIASYSHTIVWGSRGSGKSMHFKFLEPLAQTLRLGSGYEGKVKKFIESQNAFIGIYINCRDGLLSREEFRLLSSIKHSQKEILQMLYSRYLSCVLIKLTCNTFKTQLNWTLSLPINSDTIPIWIKECGCNVLESFGDMIGYLDDKCTEWLYAFDELIDSQILDNESPLDKDSFPKKTPRLTSDLLTFYEFIQNILKTQAPFFFLFDEANELSDLHQRCVNSLISIRSQKVVCIKVASQRHGFQTRRGFDSSVDETHDYTTLDLDGLYTNNREAYYKRIQQIANDRLKRCGIVGPIKEYLPPNQREVNALEKARKIAEERYFSIDEEKRPIDKINFIKKYARAIVYQEVLSAKATNTYAGFDNLVHMSSGIVRSFLDCCSKMYSRYVEKKPGREPGTIPISIQGKVIKEYSDKFIQAHLIDKLEGLERDSKEYMLRNNLLNLLQGFGSLFRARLMDKNSREPRIISISLKDTPSENLQSILDLAEREAFLHVKWYSSKRGDRNLRCYVLNRRLCPHFNLDLTGFQGRIEIDSQDLELCISNTKGFVKSIISRSKERTEEDTNQLMLFEW